MIALTRVGRLCPQCRTPLVVVGRWAPHEGSGLVGRLGVACHCVACSTKYRAQGTVSRVGVRWVVQGIWLAGWVAVVAWAWHRIVWHPGWLLAAMLGAGLGLPVSQAVASWAWWAAAKVTAVTTLTSDTNFVSRDA